MPARSLDACFYIEQPPEIELRDGLFHVTFKVGECCHFHVALPPRTFFAGLAEAGRVGRNWSFRGAEVVPFPKKDELVG